MRTAAERPPPPAPPALLHHELARAARAQLGEDLGEVLGLQPLKVRSSASLFLRSRCSISSLIAFSAASDPLRVGLGVRDAPVGVQH